MSINVVHGVDGGGGRTNHIHWIGRVTLGLAFVTTLVAGTSAAAAPTGDGDTESADVVVADVSEPDGEWQCWFTSDEILNWDHIGSSRYYIRQQLNGEDKYISSVSVTPNTFEEPRTAVRSPYGTYEVISWQGGRRSTTCEAPGGHTIPDFSCSVDIKEGQSVLSWTNLGGNKYFLRHEFGGRTDTSADFPLVA